MSLVKVLLRIEPNDLVLLASGPETGMGFYISRSAKGLLVVFANDMAMLIEPDPTCYSLDDLLNGDAIPLQTQQEPSLRVQAALPNRMHAIQALGSLLTISPLYVGTSGAIPLVANDTLSKDTRFFRYISSPLDHRFDPSTSKLKSGTYLTSDLDRHHANTGFGSVGRYALPLPVPVASVIEYTLPAGTDIKVGTVAPMFGQAGGGVEIQLTRDTKVHQGLTIPLLPY